MNFLPRVANLLLHWSCVSTRISFCKALQNVPSTQEQVLLATLKNNTKTAFGQKYHFERITSVRDYQAEVPVTNYEDYTPYIDMIMKGGANILTADPIRKLNLSSGTSSASKLLPFTARLQGEFAKGLSLWLDNLFSYFPKIKHGKAYWVFTPMQSIQSKYDSAIPIGFDQDENYFGPIKGYFMRRVLAVPPEVQYIEDIEDLYYVTLLFLLAEKNLRWISIWNPSFLRLLLARFARYHESLVRDLARGEINPSLKLEPHLRHFFKGAFRAYPQRAEEVSTIWKKKAKTPGDEPWVALWPHLELISCWADGWARHSIGEIQKMFPGVFIQGKGLLATEGVVTLPYHRKGSDSCAPVLAVTTHFFEFRNPSDGKIYLAHQLEKGQVYEVILTTGGGLYRYQLFDLVEVEQYYKGAPCMKFLGKKEMVSDLCGEKLHETHVQGVLEKCFSRFNLDPTFYFLAPEVEGGPSRYVLYLEGIRESATLSKLLREIDQALCDNFHYAYCRRLGQLAPLSGYALEHGSKELYIAHKTSQGRLGTLKLSCLERSTGWGERLPGVSINASHKNGSSPRFKLA